MQGAVTIHMEAPPLEVWRLVADVRNTGRFSPETFDAEWLDGVTEPSVGARFRGHVKRNEIGPIYWTTCRVKVASGVLRSKGIISSEAVYWSIPVPWCAACGSSSPQFS